MDSAFYFMILHQLEELKKLIIDHREKGDCMGVVKRLIDQAIDIMIEEQ